MGWIIGFAILWFGFCVAAGAGLYAYVQDEWPSLAEEHRLSDKLFALAAVPFGLTAFMGVGLACGYARGFKRFW